jgi:predicted CXXCH cytochrome family protein
MAGGITTLPPGHSNLGTDLSDDHPISFRFDATLASEDPKIKAPTQLPQAVKLDANQEMQCTTCHDAHNNTFGKFLVMDNTNSQLCFSCHQINDTTIAEHVSCAACHTMHTAPSGAMLLKDVNASETCLACHSSAPGENHGQDIAQDMTKISRHYRPPEHPPMSPGPVAAADSSITCSDCHEPHTMQTGTAAAPLISPKLGKVSGTTAAGGQTIAAQFEHEVCFKCHSDSAIVEPRIPRQIVQNNTRLEFVASAVSFHPVTAAGKNTDVPSLRSGALTSASLIYCTDCHSSDTGKTAGGSGPSGPHGSSASPLLVAAYATTDNTPESAATYALCYRCHDRTSILNNESFSGHSLHVQQQNTPCSVCHDAHGISSTQGTAANHAHLMNFDTSVVFPDPLTGRIEYRSLGPRTGECTLSCHGVAHSPKQYPAAPGLLNAPAGLRALRPNTRMPSAVSPSAAPPVPARSR